MCGHPWCHLLNAGSSSSSDSLCTCVYIYIYIRISADWSCVGTDVHSVWAVVKWTLMMTCPPLGQHAKVSHGVTSNQDHKDQDIYHLALAFWWTVYGMSPQLVSLLESCRIYATKIYEVLHPSEHSTDTSPALFLVLVQKGAQIFI